MINEMVCRFRKVVQVAQSTKVWIILIYTNKIRVKFGGVYTVRKSSWRPREGVELSCPHFYLSPRWGWVVNAMSKPLYPGYRDLVPIAQEAGWAIGPVWTGAENHTPTGIRSLDHPAFSKLLHQWHYPRLPTLLIVGWISFWITLLFYMNLKLNFLYFSNWLIRPKK
jgi:hypothetical protein